MRNGIDIDFFDFNWENKQQNKDPFSSVYKWNLPNPNVKYNFYDHKNQFIYYSGENADKMYQDIGFYDMQTFKNYFVPNAHQGTVTGMAHFMDNIVITSSIAGELKVWNVEGETMTHNQQGTDQLKSLFNPQNAQLELLFLDVSDVQGTKILSVGTSDGRLLFFFGNNLEFRQAIFGEQYVN